MSRPPVPSPIPGDSWLTPEEKPFTDFGQFGTDRLDLRVFEQDTWWVDRGGRGHLLDGMSQDYLRNVLVMLYERARNFHLAVTMKRVIEFADAVTREPMYAAFLAGEPEICEDSMQWLRKTPLAIRIDLLLTD